MRYANCPECGSADLVQPTGLDFEFAEQNDCFLRCRACGWHLPEAGLIPVSVTDPYNVEQDAGDGLEEDRMEVAFEYRDE